MKSKTPKDILTPLGFMDVLVCVKDLILALRKIVPVEGDLTPKQDIYARPTHRFREIKPGKRTFRWLLFMGDRDPLDNFFWELVGPSMQPLVDHLGRLEGYLTSYPAPEMRHLRKEFDSLLRTTLFSFDIGPVTEDGVVRMLRLAVNILDQTMLGKLQKAVYRMGPARLIQKVPVQLQRDP